MKTLFFRYAAVLGLAVFCMVPLAKAASGGGIPCIGGDVYHHVAEIVHCRGGGTVTSCTKPDQYKCCSENVNNECPPGGGDL